MTITDNVPPPNAPSQAEPTAPPKTPGLLARAIGVITAPRATFEHVAREPRWLGMFLLVAITTAVLMFAFLSTPVGQQAFLDEQVRRVESSGQQMSDQAYQAMERMLPYMRYITAGGVIVSTPVMWLVVAGVLFGVFTVFAGANASFKQVFSMVAHSGAVSLVGLLFTMPLNYFRESMTSSTNLAVFFPMLEEGSFLARMLGSIDLFLIWWVIVLAIGMAVVTRRKTRPIAIALLALYAVIAVGIAAFYAVRS